MPLIPLALGAAFAGIVFYPVFVGHDMADYWRQSLFVLPGHDSIEAGHNVPEWVSLTPLILGLGGIGLAFVMYILRPSLPAAMARTFRPIYLLFLNKWYFDELYDFLFVNAAKRLGHLLWKGGDGSVIDGLGPDGSLGHAQSPSAPGGCRAAMSITTLRHADRHRADHQLVSLLGSSVTTP